MNAPAAGRLRALLGRAVNARDAEVRALLWSFLYFFCLLGGYYILRPLRDEMGIAGGVRNLQWLFTGTFAAMLLAVPVFGFVAARFPRRRVVPVVYRFFIVNILIFFAAFQITGNDPWVARAFFIWVSIFNLFVVSVFWSFMADLFSSEQGKRLFGFIAAGGTAGALAGPALTAALAVPLGPINLLLVSALILEGAVRCIRRLLAETDGTGAGAASNEAAGRAPHLAEGDRAMGGDILGGLYQLARSPYLLGLCLYIVLYTTTSTFLYFQQAEIIAANFDDPAERTRVFAVIDLIVNALTLLAQVFVTGRIMSRFGVGVTLGVVPVLTLVGFIALSMTPQMAALVAFQSVRRAANYAVSRPAREVLYTVVSREQKYKSKNVIDTVVYRGGDALSGWAYAGLVGLGLELPAIALVAVPVSGAWLAAAWALGRGHDRRAAAQAETAAA